MATLTPNTHVKRLGIVLVLAAIGFLVIRSFAIPASWNYDVWYRGGARDDIASLPLVHGNNDSCVPCHEDVSLTGAVEEAKFQDEFFDVPDTADETESDEVYEHRTLNCEVCHGPLAEHAAGDEKIGDAVVMRDDNWQCLNCHRQLISRPQGFPQFTDSVEDHRDLGDNTRCIKCHGPHNPIEELAVDEEFNTFDLDFGGEL